MANEKAASVARLVTSSVAFNTLNTPPPVPIHFHKSPDFPGAGVRGIAGLDFQVVVGGAVIAIGQTAGDGKVDVRVPPGGSATLQLLSGGKVVAEYEVTVDNGELASLDSGDAVLDPSARSQDANELLNTSSLLGTQQRLRMLGYQIGHGGEEGTGVSALMTLEWERGVLDFQIDQGLLPDAKVGPKTKAALKRRAGS
jgi:hypothetical protein